MAEQELIKTTNVRVLLSCNIKQPSTQELWRGISEITFSFSLAVLTANAYYNVSAVEMQSH